MKTPLKFAFDYKTENAIPDKKTELQILWLTRSASNSVRKRCFSAKVKTSIHSRDRYISVNSVQQPKLDSNCLLM